MSKSSYLPKDDNGKDAWLTNLGSTGATYSGVVGLTTGDVASMQADAAFFHWTLIAQGQITAYAQQWTAFKNLVRSGADATLGPVPITPSLATMPTAVAPGIIGRATAMVARIKAAPGYNDTIGQAMEIIGADNPVDLTTLKPIITAVLDAGHVENGWTKQGMDGIEIWVDRGTGFVFLAIDTVPNYTDTAAMPAAGQSALWKYKGIYLQADQRVGQWSDVVSIPVAG